MVSPRHSGCRKTADHKTDTDDRHRSLADRKRHDVPFLFLVQPVAVFVSRPAN